MYMYTHMNRPSSSSPATSGNADTASSRLNSLSNELIRTRLATSINAKFSYLNSRVTPWDVILKDAESVEGDSDLENGMIGTTHDIPSIQLSNMILGSRNITCIPDTELQFIQWFNSILTRAQDLESAISDDLVTISDSKYQVNHSEFTQMLNFSQSFSSMISDRLERISLGETKHVMS